MKPENIPKASDAALERHLKLWRVAEKFTLNTKDPGLVIALAILCTAALPVLGSVGLAVYMLPCVVAAGLSGVLHSAAARNIYRIDTEQEARQRAIATAKAAAAAPPARPAPVPVPAAAPGPAPDLSTDFRNGTQRAVEVRTLRLSAKANAGQLRHFQSN